MSDVLPYVYKLTHKETNEFYFGYRKANKLRSELDLGIKYFTSSKIVCSRFNEFNFEIIAEFFNHVDAYWYEQQLIEEHWKQEGLLNKTYQKNNGNGMFRISGPLSKEHKLAVSRGMKGKLSPRTAENLQKLSVWQKGVPKSENHKLALRKPKTITDELLTAHENLRGSCGKSRPRECSCIFCHKKTSSNYINRHIRQH